MSGHLLKDRREYLLLDYHGKWKAGRDWERDIVKDENMGTGTLGGG